jgi:hypothetical protein
MALRRNAPCWGIAGAGSPARATHPAQQVFGQRWQFVEATETACEPVPQKQNSTHLGFSYYRSTH